VDAQHEEAVHTGGQVGLLLLLLLLLLLTDCYMCTDVFKCLLVDVQQCVDLDRL
jgi:hypothetical protein